MSLFLALGLIALTLVVAYQVNKKQIERRRSQAGNALQAEYRTDLPIDDCMDLLRNPTGDEIFAYTCIRQRDGSFLLHFTLHNPTGQPLDTVYTLRLDPGRQTVITLDFVRETFGNPEPVFKGDLLDTFICQKLSATRQM